jgi:hypothetical protein
MGVVGNLEQLTPSNTKRMVERTRQYLLISGMLMQA